MGSLGVWLIDSRQINRWTGSLEAPQGRYLS